MIPNKYGNLDSLKGQYPQSELLYACALLDDLIKEELERLPNKDTTRLFIGGFATGCSIVMAYYQQMQQATPFGGVIGLSGFQRLKIKFEDIQPENLQVIRNTPCFLYLDKDYLSTKVNDQEFNYNMLRNEIFNCKERFENFSFNVKDNVLNAITEEELALLKSWLREKYSKFHTT